MASELPDLLTPGEAAALLDVSQRTLDRYQAEGRIAPLRTPGGRRKFRRGDVEQLLPQPQQPAAS